MARSLEDQQFPVQGVPAAQAPQGYEPYPQQQAMAMTLTAASNSAAQSNPGGAPNFRGDNTLQNTAVMDNGTSGVGNPSFTAETIHVRRDGQDYANLHDSARFQVRAASNSDATSQTAARNSAATSEILPITDAGGDADMLQMWQGSPTPTQDGGNRLVILQREIHRLETTAQITPEFHQQVQYLYQEASHYHALSNNTRRAEQSLFERMQTHFE